MKRLVFFLSILLCLLASPLSAETGTEIVVNALKSTNFAVKPEIAFLEKTTTFSVPEHSLSRLASTESYGGAIFARSFAREMIAYFEVNGHPNLRQMLETGNTSALDEIAKNYSFKFVYEGPDDDKAWRMFVNYSDLFRENLTHWGWVPNSGQIHLESVTTPQASGFSGSTDGKVFKMTNPTLELPTSQWSNSVYKDFEKHGKTGNRP